MDDVLEALADGRLTVEQARARLSHDGLLAVEEWALLDAERDARTGLPEVVLAEGKDPAALEAIVRELLGKRGSVLVSRLDRGLWQESGLDRLPDAHKEYDEEARFARFVHPGSPEPAFCGRVAVVTAGTADRAVAKEAVATVQGAWVEARLWVDRGVAAPARLAPTLREVLAWRPDVVIVAAGREGTLATLVAGLLPIPVIGLPVATGYGHAGRGEAALSAMLQSCSPLCVVNIDAGVQAGLVAAQIARRTHARGEKGSGARAEEPEEAVLRRQQY